MVSRSLPHNFRPTWKQMESPPLSRASHTHFHRKSLQTASRYLEPRGGGTTMVNVGLTNKKVEYQNNSLFVVKQIIHFAQRSTPRHPHFKSITAVAVSKSISTVNAEVNPVNQRLSKQSLVCSS